MGKSKENHIIAEIETRMEARKFARSLEKESLSNVEKGVYVISTMLVLGAAVLYLTGG